VEIIKKPDNVAMRSYQKKEGKRRHTKTKEKERKNTKSWLSFQRSEVIFHDKAAEEENSSDSFSDIWRGRKRRHSSVKIPFTGTLPPSIFWPAPEWKPKCSRLRCVFHEIITTLEMGSYKMSLRWRNKVI